MMLILYIIFAIISIALNLAFQHLSFLVYQGFADLYIALFVGTLAGLIVKYILDKKFIFFYEVIDKKDDARKFLLYSFMGVFTTMIFWISEIMFDKIWIDNTEAKYFGAVVGLSIGYIIKYFLDKKYVFIEKHKILQ